MKDAEIRSRAEQIILTAGPSITDREIEYVTDAVINGWNHHHSDYIKKFESAFAEYIGVKHALATASCTGALHISLLALGVGPGDEVIVPETTWIATVSAVKYVGATPVFADIRPDSWVMDAGRVAELITSKTKVIIPVHLYGHPVEMEILWKLSEQHGIAILEDAAPSIGASYRGKRTGNLSRIAAFSFQGAKALATGEGGMLVTNDDALIARARFLNDHGRDPKSPLASLEIGYKYKMSNMQGALGLAQIQRCDEIVAKKRQIFKWYHERLKDIEELSLNTERPECFNIYWMSSIVLGPKVQTSREDFMQRLKAVNVDSRPFFSPISSFPMFKGLKVNNPVAYSIPLRGINLPSGHNRTEDEVDYICNQIRELLGRNAAKSPAIKGDSWLAFANDTIQTLRAIKNAPAGESTIAIAGDAPSPKGRLVPVTSASLASPADIELLAKWREQVQNWFPSQFTVTIDGTKVWVDKQLLQLNDRILFFVENHAGKKIGHVGLFRFNYEERHCELDNIVRGEEGSPGLLSAACDSLIAWSFETLGVKKMYLRVTSDNERALKLYQQLGFAEIQRVPLRKVTSGSSSRWIEVIGRPYEKVARYFVTMELPKESWAQSRR